MPVFILYSTIQHASADVSLMLVASKSDLEDKREVTRDDGLKVCNSAVVKGLELGALLLEMTIISTLH